MALQEDLNALLTQPLLMNREIAEHVDALEAFAMSYVDVNIANAALDTLNATPVSLVPAPGAAYVTEFLGATFLNDFVSAALELGSGTLDFRYENSSGGLCGQVTNALAESAADAYIRVVPLACAMLVNKAIVLHASADITSGGGNLKLRVYYRTVAVADLGV